MGIPEKKYIRGTNLEGANFEAARHLSIDQLSKVKTLPDTKL